MGDWDFLYEMREQGYSPEDIADAAACGYNPFDGSFDISDDLDLEDWEFSDEFDEGLDDDFIVHPKLPMIFQDLVDSAIAFHSITNRYLQIWGELGELYAEIKYGIKRHKPHTKGSDGRLGNDFIEIKTISPEKKDNKVKVKCEGNFNKLLIVKINEDFTFESRILLRKNLNPTEGKHFRASWNQDK